MGISNIINLSLVTAAIRMATPIVFSALGGIFSEKVGIINIALEGIMLISGFTGVLISFYTKNPWLGVLVATITGALIGLLHAIFTVKFRGNQIVSGVGINVLAFGLTGYMSQIIWGSRGASDPVKGLSAVSIPILDKIPILNQILNNHTPLVYIMFLCVIISYIVLFKTPFGLRIRATGEAPASADTAGVNVYVIKYLGLLISGALAGLGGVFLSLSHLSIFAWGMTGGRGFIALAAMIFGNWLPQRVLFTGLFFGFADALQMRLQALGILPSQIILMIPYLLVIGVLAGVVGKVKAPSDYKSYIKE